jgi:membrane fusion protein (multidrug efflux system)
MEVSRVRTLVLLGIALGLPECRAFGQQPRGNAEPIKVAVVQSKSMTIRQAYLCRINARHHIEVRTPAEGYLVAIAVKEGQAVKRGDLLFQVGPPTGKKTPEGKNRDGVVSIKAPFDGRVGSLPRGSGSYLLQGEALTTLSDNSAMSVVFKVPEKRYLDYMAERREDRPGPDLDLILADQSKFPHRGKLDAIGAAFESQTGSIAFSASFPNPDGLLRHGQTGTVLLSRVFKDAVVIPQRATFEGRGRRYVYAVDKDHVARLREIVIQEETDDLFIVKKGVGAGERIVVDGVGQVQDGNKVE